MNNYNKRTRESVIRQHSYSFLNFRFFNYDILKFISYIGRKGKSGETYNDVIIMADTESSKETPGTVCKNYIVAWTISIRAYDHNIVTLYGTKPSEMIETIDKIVVAMPGEKTIIYFHNLAWDWVFLRKWMMQDWGTPLHQLNTKPHYPVFIEFANGICLRDSLILAQRGLDKWAKDMDVQHKKASGYWDYDKIRHQEGQRFSPFEKTYIEHDTLAGVECIQKTMDTLHKIIYSMPYTATGIPREAVRKIGKEHGARELFLKIVADYGIQLILENCFHGGYTHNNRHFIETIIRDDTEAYDFASSYPTQMILGKMPMGKFGPFENCTVDFILRNAEDYAYIFRLIMIKPRLKDDFIPMPVLQKSKMVRMINGVEDNGRILCAEYCEIWLDEVDLEIIAEQYTWQAALCIDVHFCHKDYLPRWFTDYVYQCFVDKTKLKGGDPVQYSIAKAKLNSLYGMCVQRPVKVQIEEDYLSGDYKVADDQDEEKLYTRYVNNRNNILPYQWGVWVTSYAMRELFRFGKLAGTWLYSDTDSCYGINWDKDGIREYNENRKKQLLDRGYGAVIHNNREYWLGIAELDGQYKEFISVGAKRYATRDINGKLKITVAGVPKAGVNCLKDDLHNFHAGFIFDGETTGKKQHTYFFEEDIWTDEHGNERGDSIDLSPASYLLDSVRSVNWEKIFEEEIEVQVYDPKEVL